MQERRVRAEPAAAYLLVTAKGHVPRRESEERYPAGTEKTHCCMQESRLVGYMLYHVVRKHNVELSVEPAVAVEHIAAHKAAFHPVLGKKRLRLLYAPVHYIHSRYVAAAFGKRFEVAPFAAAYLEHARCRA